MHLPSPATRSYPLLSQDAPAPAPAPRTVSGVLPLSQSPISPHMGLTPCQVGPGLGRRGGLEAEGLALPIRGQEPSQPSGLKGSSG